MFFDSKRTESVKKTIKKHKKTFFDTSVKKSVKKHYINIKFFFDTLAGGQCDVSCPFTSRTTTTDTLALTKGILID